MLLVHDREALFEEPGPWQRESHGCMPYRVQQLVGVDGSVRIDETVLGAAGPRWAEVQRLQLFGGQEVVAARIACREAHLAERRPTNASKYSQLPPQATASPLVATSMCSPTHTTGAGSGGEGSSLPLEACVPRAILDAVADELVRRKDEVDEEQVSTVIDELHAVLDELVGTFGE
jgi:hypothetical protein